MSLYPRETQRDDGLGRLCEHECHGCGVLLFRHQPDISCGDCHNRAGRTDTLFRYRRIMEVLCEPCAEIVGEVLWDLFATWSEVVIRHYREVNDLSPCCGAGILGKFEKCAECGEDLR